MKMRVTSVTNSEVGQSINAVSVWLEDTLAPAFADKEYGAGVEQLSIFFVSVSHDFEENHPFCVMHNRQGRYKDIFSGKSVRYVSFAVPVNPDELLKKSSSERPGFLTTLLLRELSAPPYELPKSFDYPRLYDDLKRVLAGVSGG